MHVATRDGLIAQSIKKKTCIEHSKQQELDKTLHMATNGDQIKIIGEVAA